MQYYTFRYGRQTKYPDMRYDAELYQSMPKSFEVSLHFRTLKYATSTTNFFTGSVGWYNGNNYWSFPPYLTPRGTGTSKSGNLIFRRYRSDADNYLELSAGIGYSPENNQNNTSGNLAPIVDLKSQKINTGYYFSSPNKRNNWGTYLVLHIRKRLLTKGIIFGSIHLPFHGN